MAEEGTFREDLYYRLNVVNIHLPPLRERREDIPSLIDFLIQRHRRELKRPFRGVDNAALKLLMSQPWKGNVRELDNVIEHAMIVGEGEWITLADLPRALRDKDGGAAPGGRRRPARGAARLREDPHRVGPAAHRQRQAHGRRAARPVAVVAVPQDRGAEHRP